MEYRCEVIASCRIYALITGTVTVASDTPFQAPQLYLFISSFCTGFANPDMLSMSLDQTSTGEHRCGQAL